MAGSRVRLTVEVGANDAVVELAVAPTYASSMASPHAAQATLVQLVITCMEKHVMG